MAPKKSIFRGPEAQHFQLVHRSLRDPLLNDPEASDRVLKPVERANDRQKGFTLADLDATIDKSSLRANEGEAAVYGITYDDSSYDYMSHLRPIQGGIDSVLLAAPRGSGVGRGMKTDRKGKGKAKEQDLFLPPEAFASKDEVSLEEVYGREENIPMELQGLQPDMDPHLRQVLEALDDDAFVDEETAEDPKDFWGELMAGGEADEYEREDYEFQEWGVDEAPAPPPTDEEQTWEDRFKAFKRDQDRAGDSDEEIERSEMADTIGSLASNLGDMIVRGGKKRHGKRGPSDATGMSMSSSSMFRNQGLRDLDTRFDKIERDYELEDDEDEYLSDDGTSIAPSMMSSTSKVSLFSSSTSSAVPEVSRADFDAILDDFLENYEVVGKRLRPALGGTGLSGPEKLQVLRAAVEGEHGEEKEKNRKRVMEIERMGRGLHAFDDEEEDKVEETHAERWDVETILTTYTNTENHPAVIRSKRIAAPQPIATSIAPFPEEGSDDEDSGSETEREEPRVTVIRPKGESAEDRRARKAAVKAERSARRAEKKAHTATFSNERRKQLATRTKVMSNGRAADVAVGQRGVVSLS
ncbi:Low temperature viability protein-domain-containing protein [Kockovaella imperatae]|uniref:Low temperature viability protein-domain-containing protein n=1 Tax=Kockovaella imperatae TaxID=4999 RepID=A0A1Y1UI17_9TREE|nr:Low temperature viability protein-domain-containing protein [Kockovaella imperatae]ORX37700.1 Low temperature viability protein-domain-containing protein [Kockovaella imperatae]